MIIVADSNALRPFGYVHSYPVTFWLHTEYRYNWECNITWISLSSNFITQKQAKEVVVINYHNNPSQSCDVVTEGALPQPLYHPHSNFLKAKDSDSLILLLVNMSAGLASPSIFLTEIGLEKFLLESMWERNQWYLTEINLLVGVRRGYEATNTEPLLSSKTYD